MAPERITLEMARNAGEVDFWDYLLKLFDRNPEIFKSRVAHDAFIESLPRGLQLHKYLVVFDGDILNGGIRQFFRNHSPWEVEQTVAALEEIGAQESADLIRRAIAVHEEQLGWERWERGSREKYIGPGYTDPEYEDQPVLDAFDEARCDDDASARDYTLLHAYQRRFPERFVHG